MLVCPFYDFLFLFLTIDFMIGCVFFIKGRKQATEIPTLLERYGGVDSFDAIIVSPLSRALITALLGFGKRPEGVPMIVHPGCRESGSGIPENQPRRVSELKKDRELYELPKFEEVDFSLLPPGWPQSSSNQRTSTSATSSVNLPHVVPTKGVVSKDDPTSKKGKHSKVGKTDKNDKHGEFLNFLRQLPYRKIAVVCHCNVIRSLLQGQITVHTKHCNPFAPLMFYFNVLIYSLMLLLFNSK
jgi:hypothetical protein